MKCKRLMTDMCDCSAMSQHCEEPECWMEDRRLVITWLFSICLLTGSHNMINHSLRALVGGGGCVYDNDTGRQIDNTIISPFNKT